MRKETVKKILTAASIDYTYPDYNRNRSGKTEYSICFVNSYVMVTTKFLKKLAIQLEPLYNDMISYSHKYSRDDNGYYCDDSGNYCSDDTDENFQNKKTALLNAAKSLCEKYSLLY